MKKHLPLVIALIVLACSDHDTNPEGSAITKACKVCQANPGSMQWLRDIIQEDNGNVYAINTRDGVIIIHQPVFMSCLACVRYTCSGVSISSVSSDVQEELQNGMKKSNLIYEAKF